MPVTERGRLMIKRLAILAAALLVFAAAFALKESQQQSPSTEKVPISEEKKRVALPRLVDLGSDKCIPCKRMAPILEGLSQEYRNSFTVEVLDVRKNPALGQEWAIRVIPTQVFIDAAGVERFRHQGFMSKETILEKWKELGIEVNPDDSDKGI
jgi:thioredoxin 1